MTASPRKKLTYYPTRIQEELTTQTEYLDRLMSQEGLVRARTKALDQIGANICWLGLGYPEQHMGARELYLILQRLADYAIKPDLVGSE